MASGPFPDGFSELFSALAEKIQGATLLEGVCAVAFLLLSLRAPKIFEIALTHRRESRRITHDEFRRDEKFRLEIDAARAKMIKSGKTRSPKSGDEM